VKRRAVVSIHDVEPDTLSGVTDLLELLGDACRPPADLLVVPGVEWSEAELNRLRGWEARGHTLVGHGWSHRGIPPRSAYHRMHALALSRDMAEHLSRPREDLVERLRRCHAWFAGVGLKPPRMYVPPAWALGALTREDLVELPFDLYETLTGFLDVRAGVRRTLPLVGFEADTPFRCLVLRTLNAANLSLARSFGRPVRIALHPRDLEYGLARELERLVRNPAWHFVSSVAALSPPTAPRPDPARSPAAREPYQPEA